MHSNSPLDACAAAGRAARDGLPALLGAILVLAVPASAGADGRDGAAPPPEAPIVLEARPTNARHVIVTNPLTSPPARIAFGPFTSIQANVDADGNNIVNDAANEPSIAVDPTAPNRIAVGWRQFDTINSNFRQAGWSYSRDGGRTWSGQQVIEPGLFRSDPVLGAANDGTFYYSSLTVDGGSITADVFQSDDAGATWPTKRFAYGGDKQWLAVDNTGGVGDGNRYQGWNTAGNDYFPAQFNRFLTSGLQWQAPVEYDPSGSPPARPVFGQVTVGPDSSVYVAGSQNSGDTDVFWVVRSLNAWNPFESATFPQVAEIDLGGNLRIGVGPNPAGLLGQVNVSVDHSGGPMHGWVYVLCAVDPPGPDPMDVHFIRSIDGGLTWSTPVRINTDAQNTNHWQWFGTMSVAPGGRIDAVWNDTRDSQQVNISQLYHSFSLDGGVTWSANESLSPSFNSFVGWPQQNKLGDYYDMVSDDVGAHLIWAATFNAEQDVYYLRIGDYDCNGNAVADTDDLLAGTSGDCNENDIPDECEIAAGELEDANGNGVPDLCEADCPGDANGDGEVNTVDLLGLLAAWGTNDPLYDIAPAGAPDGVVNTLDLLDLLAAWGPCPG